jgi:hypothetical protein
MPEPGGPRLEYDRRLTERRAVVDRYARRDAWLSHARFATLGAAAIVAWMVWWAGTAPAWWLLGPGAVFGSLVLVHGAVVRTRQRYERAVAFYEDGLARVDDRWAGHGEPGHRFLDDAHLYATDLDIFGRGSLFELLNTTRTQTGEEMLAAWLLAPATPEDVRARQQAVAELTPRLDLREDLAILGGEVRRSLHPQALAAWGLAPRLLPWRSTRAAALVLGAVSAAALTLWGAGMVSGAVPAAAFVANVALAWPLQARVRRVTHDVTAAGDELAILAHLLARLERESFTSPRLAALRGSLDTAGRPPSVRIAALRRLVDLLDARRNQLFVLFSYALLWATSFAHAIDAWRAASGAAVPRWIAAVGEFEALSALAGYAYEHPDDPFPVVETLDSGPLFDGDGLGHPLIPADRCVRNDVRLAGAGRGEGPSGLVVSGSNMSGKSTLLRTVGVNAVLALAGAPVRARRLALTPLVVGATLRIQDSLQGGTSRFYAEITRLRDIVALTAGPIPPLFLLDEMLNGTNSHDRGVGAEAVLRGLIARGAIGLVTTHDLSLSRIADDMAPRAANVHFEDQLEEGTMRFDYVCRPGVMTRSNALALMRAVGLEV